MTGLLDFLSAEAGQRRTRARDEAIENVFSWLLGPTGIPDRLNAIGLLNPVQDIYEAGGNARDGDYAGAAINTASALMPVVGAKLAGGGLADDAANIVSDTLTGWSNTARGAADWGGEFARAEDGMFLGPSALNADLGALETAKRMASEGADKNAIWNDTGWFQGVDGKWRFEIDDSQMGFTDRFVDKFVADDASEYGSNFSGVVKHPELTSNYDFWQDVDVERSGYRGGSYYPDNRAIRVKGASSPEIKETLAHEIQHDIQSLEGFAQGSSPGEMATAYLTIGKDVRAHNDAYNLLAEVEANGGDWERALQDFKELGAPIDADGIELARKYKTVNVAKAARDRYANAKLSLEPLTEPGQWQQDTGFGPYKRVAGEVEARNVEKRLNMSPEQRRATPPWETQDVPDDRQLIVQNRGLMLSEIVRKYGIAGAAAITGLSMAEIEGRMNGT